MRKVIAGAFVSLDGIMQAPGGPEEDTSSGFKYGGWSFPYYDETVDQAWEEALSRPYDLLLGRKTYDTFASFWPDQEDGPIAETARTFNRITKYVATTSKAPLTWNNSVALVDGVAGVARLRKEDGPDLLIQGSSVLIQSLHGHDLIDEYKLLVFPVVLGSGKRLFEPGAKAAALKQVSAKNAPSGVTIVTYVPDGDVKAGSFAPDGKPSEG